MERLSTSERNEYILQIVLHVILIAGLFIVIYPLLFMIMNSVKQFDRILNCPAELPDFKNLNTDGYKQVFEDFNFIRLFANTTFIVVTLTFFHVLVNAAAGFSLSKLKYPGKKVVFKLMLWTLMIPGTIMLIPLYVVMNQLGWIDTYLPLILPSIASVYNIFLIRQFIDGISDAFIEAARIDGANPLYIFFKIILPMSVPVLTGVAVILAMGTWNDLQAPLFYLRSEDNFTIQLALYKFTQDTQFDLLPARFAGMTLSTIPVILLFLFAQKYFIKGFGTFSLK